MKSLPFPFIPNVLSDTAFDRLERLVGSSDASLVCGLSYDLFSTEVCIARPDEGPSFMYAKWERDGDVHRQYRASWIPSHDGYDAIVKHGASAPGAIMSTSQEGAVHDFGHLVRKCLAQNVGRERERIDGLDMPEQWKDAMRAAIAKEYAKAPVLPDEVVAHVLGSRDFVDPLHLKASNYPSLRGR